MSEAKLLLVEDDASLREALLDTLMLAQYECIDVASGEDAILALKQHQFDLVISDVQMQGIGGLGLLNFLQQHHPKLPVLLMTAYATIGSAVDAIKLGAVDYLAKPFAPEVLLNQVSRYLPLKQNVDQPVVADEKSLALLALAQRVAASDASVMILGPSGSGKEVLARYIHQHSSRADQAFVAINCAAIPENMLEATLFGYEKGAFTGAYQACPGKFEQAQGGTLLLDEISEMDLGLQAKLLRVLQEREVERLGGRKTIKLDVRVLATSNRDLKAVVAAGGFREDLYYRINVFPLAWPALSQRPADILPLARHLLVKHAKALNVADVPELDENARRRLLSHRWPGNVRELDNVIQRALILRAGQVITANDIIIDAQDVILGGEDLDQFAAEPDGLGEELKAQEHVIILETLNQCQGSRKLVAEKLGISARTLRYKMARMRDMGIQLPN
ncbi:sigma-54-dependent Fis family transcriptional regulator [Shewanella baltica]|jgi:two-component system, response regulator FlrC|uniref:Sigma-54 dependent transcriptional regulator n=1 Tax=Shewanella vaxholmensis TaxID=3063535 RepID=A0ABU9UMX8_9GAMM|nr:MULTISPECIES: sigma-54 dependent transcriptional regulator [Shewanella]AUD61071.1 sigma-54-dependent Fis family transcriptional regulator [Shewanella sp. Pdp11]MCS6098352.1 sigma-54-dependent Fis family transcriptional regulator [Shewanella baltica]MCS6113349.1 sigma-54-dependent Fis family transcriptional regulator [Shewanella baltica]MCS6126399.1 sigma-54-dependent Fis family transcriptional regulator [Shewanella baltica]MCS6136688.1 sigma-54-dependent Fis family transcriptional regulator